MSIPLISLERFSICLALADVRRISVDVVLSFYFPTGEKFECAHYNYIITSMQV